MTTGSTSNKDTAPGTADEGRADHARRILADLRLLGGERLDQALAIGRLLLEWEREALHEVVGHKTQDQVIAEAGLRRSTALSSKRLFLKFGDGRFHHLGLGKLRLLAANFIDNPESLIFDGVEVAQPDGTTERRSVEDMTYRELQQALRGIQPPKEPRKPRSGKLVDAIAEALVPVLEGFGSGGEDTASTEPSASPVEADPLDSPAIGAVLPKKQANTVLAHATAIVAATSPVAPAVTANG